MVDPDDVEMLQDLIIAAVNGATRKADEMIQNEMGKLTGGMGMPGLFLAQEVPAAYIKESGG